MQRRGTFERLCNVLVDVLWEEVPIGSLEQSGADCRSPRKVARPWVAAVTLSQTTPIASIQLEQVAVLAIFQRPRAEECAGQGFDGRHKRENEFYLIPHAAARSAPKFLQLGIITFPSDVHIPILDPLVASPDITRAIDILICILLIVMFLPGMSVTSNRLALSSQWIQTPLYILFTKIFGDAHIGPLDANASAVIWNFVLMGLAVGINYVTTRTWILSRRFPTYCIQVVALYLHPTVFFSVLTVTRPIKNQGSYLVIVSFFLLAGLLGYFLYTMYVALRGTRFGIGGQSFQRTMCCFGGTGCARKSSRTAVFSPPTPRRTISTCSRPT